MGSSIVWERSLADRYILDVAVEIEAPCAAFAAYAGVLRPAERRAELADEEAVDPHRAGDDRRGDPHGAVLAAGEQGGGQAVFGAVGDLDHLVVAAEGVPGQHRAEDLLPEDLLVPPGAGDQGRLEIEFALVVPLAAPEDVDALLAGPVHEALDAFEVLRMDERPHPRRRITRVGPLIH